MKKYLSFLLLALLVCCLNFVVTPSYGQECGTASYFKTIQSLYPELLEKRAKMEQQIKEQQGKYAVTGLITIPVVIHVVFNNAAENISDDQIYESLAVLNEDFRTYNQGITAVNAAFRPLISDIEIQFCLASVDPNGDPTSGITRTATTHGPFPVPASTIAFDDVKHASAGGADAWDTDDYLNMWICDISGAGGYAVYPGTSPADQDGIVIQFLNNASFERGRVMTHEVGHWLNLIHIWGDDHDDPDTCSGTDEVADTPNAALPNGGCPNFPLISCTNGLDGDLFYNHMDYTDSDCRVMFSSGQRDRMRAQFMPGGLRVGLLTSNGCGGACPRAYYVTNDFNADVETLEANDMIYAWNTISGSSDIVYDSGESIFLKPPFHVQNGNRFRAFIDGCTGPKPEGRSREMTRASAFTVAPNPFSDLLSVQFEISKTSTVTVQLSDAFGRLITAPINNQTFDAGQHAIQLASGQLPPGLYYVMLSTPDGRRVQKVVKSD